ncbi:MAG: hypothetical protein J6X25_00800 [Bacteroidales bacterium]|nr:hypothetical protein [Bacteroidales bacterium]
MKKLLLFAAALFWGVAVVNAQDNMCFNHLAAGLTLGFDGIGIQVAAPATSFLQVRAGYAFHTPANGTGSFGTHDMDNGNQANLDDMPIVATSYKGGNGELFVDFFPGKKEIFRITAGAFINNGKFLSLKGDMRECMLPEDYTHTMTKGSVVFSTDAAGYGYGVAFTWPVLPYIGIGTGRAVNLDKESRFVFTFDAGIAFCGKIKAYTYSFASGEKVPYAVTSAATVDESGEQQDQGFIDAVTSIPLLPLVKFGLFYRIF